MPARRKESTANLVVANKVGLHARPAAMLVRVAQQYDAEIEITYCARVANAKSILGVLTLCAERGAEVTVVAVGDDADAAIEAIAGLFARRFEEHDGDDGGRTAVDGEGEGGDLWAHRMGGMPAAGA